MALLKTFTNNKGMQTTYHRINSLTVYPTYMIIDISSYLNEDYRLLEKEYHNIIGRINEIQKILNSLNSVVTEINEEGEEIVIEDNTEKIAELNSELNILLESKNNEHCNLSLNSHVISVPFNVDLDSFGFSQVYSIIKQNELFEGAQDC